MEWFAIATITAVVISFVVGTVFNINIGLLCIITGFLASVLCGKGGNQIVIALSPTVFILMVGILFMYTIANKNGTFGKICNILLKLVRGNRVLMIFAFALTGGAVCGLGAGGLGTSSLMCGPAAAMAKKIKVDPLLMSTTTMHGIFAGQFSPVSALAIPILAYLAKAGFPGLGGKIMVWNMVIELLAVIVAFIIFGGRELLKSSKEDTYTLDLKEGTDTKFNLQNWVTVICILLLIVNILTIRLNIGLIALSLGIIMLMFEVKKGLKDTSVIMAMPWGMVLMITGTMALLSVMGEAGGTALIVKGIHSLNIGVFGLLLLIAAAGVISFYALSLPVILAILPLAIELCKVLASPQLIPGMMIAICVASTIVDVSPMSNNGALFLASMSTENESDAKRMFNKMFAYGAAQIIIWSIICWLLFVILGL